VARRRTMRRETPLDVQLPITPMLDMSFQLLAFFVMTFQAASAQEGRLDMFLPKAGAPMAKAPEQVELTRDSDAEIDKEGDLTVVVASRGGDIESLTIREKVGSTPVADLKELRPALVKLRAAVGNKDNIRIEADGKLKYGRL